MILSVDSNPKYSLYYIGGLILKSLEHGEAMLLDDIINNLLNKFNGELAINYIYYGFDWLFLLSLVDIKNNKVILCK